MLAFGQYCFKIPDFFWVAQDIYLDQIFLLFTASFRSQSLDQPLVPGVLTKKDNLFEQFWTENSLFPGNCPELFQQISHSLLAFEWRNKSKSFKQLC